MATRGRKPKPTALKILEGNPGKRPLNENEPIPPKGNIKCPTWLLPEAKKEWKRLAPSLEAMGVLTMADLTAFEGYCQAYRLFMEGKSPAYIARFLSSCNIPSPAGRPQWRPETVKSILSNEKYKGDAILQKTFCTDFLTKKMKVNEGEVPQYYVENSHPAIISPEMFEAVQAELAKRKRSNHRNYTPHCFSGRIFCDECGALYGSKVWHSKTVWQCNARHKEKTACQTPALRGETLQNAFVMAINRTLRKKDEIIRICEATMEKRCDIQPLKEEQKKLQAELEVTRGLMERLIALNAATVVDQDEYNRQFAEYEARYDTRAERGRRAVEKHYGAESNVQY